MENIALHKREWVSFCNIQKQPLRGAQKGTGPKYFFKLQENVSLYI